jgi:putative flippase GtrA
LTGQAVRFLVVGVSNTAITLATYALLVGAGVPAIGASVLGFTAGALNGFLRNRSWTFRSDRRGPGAVARYVAVLTLGLGLNALGVALAVRVAELPKVAGEIVALPPVTLMTFLLARSWVFAARDGTGGPGRAVPRPR